MPTYNARTGQLAGRVNDYAAGLDPATSKFIQVAVTLTFPVDEGGRLLDRLRLGQVAEYPTEDYATYLSSHQTIANKLRRGATLGRTRFGTKKEHNDKYTYRKWYDELTGPQRTLITKFNIEGLVAGHRQRYGNEHLATHEALHAVTTLRPGDRAWTF